MELTTREELGALAVGSIIKDAHGDAWQKQRWLFGDVRWMVAGDERPADEHYGPVFPVLVIWNMERSN